MIKIPFPHSDLERVVIIEDKRKREEQSDRIPLQIPIINPSDDHSDNHSDLDYNPNSERNNYNIPERKVIIIDLNSSSYTQNIIKF